MPLLSFYESSYVICPDAGWVWSLHAIYATRLLRQDRGFKCVALHVFELCHFVFLSGF